MRPSSLVPLLPIALAAAVQAASAASGQIHLTDFAKTNNIYTNLNQQYPVTGTGVPGSGTGTPNASFLYDPYAFNQSHGVPDSDLAGDNGIAFRLVSDAVGHDFAEIGGNPLTVSTNVTGAETVYALMTSYVGQSFSLTATGSAGASRTYSDIFLPDFNGGGAVNQCGAGACAQTVYQVLDVGAGGSGNSATGAYNYYNLVEVAFTLGPSFQGQALTSLQFNSNGYETLLLGVTAAGDMVSVPAVPEPSSWALMGGGLALAGASSLRRRRYAGQLDARGLR